MMSALLTLWGYSGTHESAVLKIRNHNKTPLPLGGNAPSNLLRRGVVISGVVAAYTLHPTLFPFYENQYVI